MPDPKLYGGLPTKLPTDAIPVSGATAADVVDTTDVAVANFTAPGAGYRFYITEALALNKTTAQTPLLDIKDSAGKIYATIPAHNVVDAVAEAPPQPVKFDPPLRIDENVAMEIAAQTAVGDCRVTLNGFKGTTANEPASV